MPANEHLLRWFPDFDRNGAIWRYIDREKFNLLVKDSALWLARADLFDDSFEGSISDMTRKMMPYGPDVTAEMVEQFNVTHAWRKQWTNVTCWQYSNHENALMWAAYAKNGVAIRTTYAKLAAQLPDQTLLAPVMYKNFGTELVPEGTYMRYFVKRHFFGSEHEVRGVLINAPPNAEGTEDLGRDNPERGMSISVDLSQLIDAVVTRPYAPSEEIASIKAILSAAGLKIPVQESELSGNPILN